MKRARDGTAKDKEQLIKVVLASVSEIKLNSCWAAFRECFVGCRVQVVGVKGIDSNVNDQPMGMDETIQGARNRLVGLLARPDVRGADFAVSIENGVVKVGSYNFDIGFCVIRDLATGLEALVPSA
eukprot:CAMPEP_0119137534 /NCGR_PEP_ID=MMETSP1310-20130426/23819_1 /TAXON_ID=464262 /ORGANISM="Genus nov. species nov., Strain RCC2339" /LENGTH=125 /DNA_ID=CAMNT_0007128631 /DNA_START=79 /DNA_END=453 /DNA_ORIENTATION=-